MIVIVDYGSGNSGSNLNMIRKIGIEAVVSRSPDVIAQASGIVLPGVGAFDSVAKNLKASGLCPLLEERVKRDKVPFLGICVGMQLLVEGSEEGTELGLGWIPGYVRRFSGIDDRKLLVSTSSQSNVSAAANSESGTAVQNDTRRLKIPHMGWNNVTPLADEPLFSELEHDARFYFVHSFHVDCPAEFAIASAHYGCDFTCAVRRGNIMGVQFHPEKSHRFGMRLYRNFAAIAC